MNAIACFWLIIIQNLNHLRNNNGNGDPNYEVILWGLKYQFLKNCATLVKQLVK